jgi:hypothetical protein
MAKKGRPFQKFMTLVSDKRREGDKDIKLALMAEMYKTVGNSAFGGTILNKNKHRKISYADERVFNIEKRRGFYYKANQIDSIYEVETRHKMIKQDRPIQVGCSIFQDAKLRMLEFYYDCIDKYINREDFQYMQMDTDSAYIAFTDKNIENLIKPEMLEEYKKDKYNWFIKDDTKENAAYYKREPGIFKPEWQGYLMVCTTCKMYYGEGDKGNKSTAKGVQHKTEYNKLDKESYLDTLFNNNIQTCMNTGMRMIDNKMHTYETLKNGLTSVYDKRIVLEDGISTIPLNI